MRPFCIATLGTIIGIIIGLYFKSIAFFVFIIIVIGLIIFKKYKKELTIFLICFLLFFTYTYMLENKFENICKTYNNKKIKIYGIITSNAEKKEYKTIYKVKVNSVEDIENNTVTKTNFNILCNVKKLKENDNLKYGDKVIISSVFEEPSIQKNEGGFNYKSYLKTKLIVGTVNVNYIDVNIIGEEISESSLIYKLKGAIMQKIYNILPSNEAALCIGLLLGEKSEISEDIQQSFRDSSLSHMLAISGAHISYILLGISNFLVCIKFHKRWSNVIIIIFLIFFMKLVGASPSVTRACIMCILNLIANLIFKKSDIYQNISVSSFIILLFNPYALLDIGFQLSYGGTIGIAILSKKTFNKTKSQNTYLTKILESVKQIITVSISANIIILPIMVYHFNTISFTFLISNILASPILGINLILGMIFIILSFSPIYFFISYFLKLTLQLLNIIANICSNLPFSQVLIITPKIWQIVVYYLIILCLIYKKKIKLFLKFYLHISKYKLIYKLTVTILLFFIFLPYIFNIIPSDKLKIHFIDVGQGDSTLIITPLNKTILIDGGGSEIEGLNIGEKILLPYILNKGIVKINYMIFTHFDTDHCQGLIYVIQKIKVENIIIGKQFENSQNYEKFIEVVKEKNIKIYVVEAGKQIKIENDLYINILWPDSENVVNENVLNNNSLVFKLIYQNFSMLFTGDIEEKSEKAILRNYKNNTQILNATVLKVAHHGSKTSSIKNFLEAVKPKIALIGVGENNTFGHPSNITLEGLKLIKCKIYRTDENGEITLEINKKGKIYIYKILN